MGVNLLEVRIAEHPFVLIDVGSSAVLVLCLLVKEGCRQVSDGQTCLASTLNCVDHLGFLPVVHPQLAELWSLVSASREES
ncbi:hypothetical protein KC19_VG105400 [Ceratodon purpureus]|uniref:Uncharacterized protein n=1 Tax=Ceratodon purpureus TaxID=3225 RepID=A0A8T0HP32_CERPU|nr:hypothetical protein KC19_VG105400 [Ceratodon purpureus]